MPQRRTMSRALALGAAALVACAAAPRPAAAQSEPPVNITAERMEYFSEKDLVIFSGKALAVRQEATLAADRMEVTLGRSGESAGGGEGGEGAGGNSVRSIVATGGVNFRQEVTDAKDGTKRERFATGERGEYDGEAKIVTLTGNPKLWERQNVITGEVMKFFVDEQRFVVEGGEKAPVGLTIYPESKKKEEE